MEIHYSSKSNTSYLKWQKNPEADRYKISSSAGHSEFVTKNIYKIPDDIDLQQVSLFVTDYKGEKKLGEKKEFKPESTKFFFLS